MKPQIDTDKHGYFNRDEGDKGDNFNGKNISLSLSIPFIPVKKNLCPSVFICGSKEI